MKNITPSVTMTKQRHQFAICISCRMRLVGCISLLHTLHTGSTIPLLFNIRRILLPVEENVSRYSRRILAYTLIIPVTTFTCAIPCESLNTTPICEGVAPFFASLQIWSTTCSGVVLSHAGGVREYGIALALMPLPLLWRRPMVTA